MSHLIDSSLTASKIAISNCPLLKYDSRLAWSFQNFRLFQVKSVITYTSFSAGNWRSSDNSFIA